MDRLTLDNFLLRAGAVKIDRLNEDRYQIDLPNNSMLEVDINPFEMEYSIELYVPTNIPMANFENGYDCITLVERSFLDKAPTIKNYFTLDELIVSDIAKSKGIDNTPNPKQMVALNSLVEFLDPIREAWGSAIRVNSGYRCPELNDAVGGSKTSAHMLGYAVDLYPTNGKFEEFKKFILEYLEDKKFDQCIIEKSGNSEWIHLGLYNNAGEQRKQVFSLIMAIS